MYLSGFHPNNTLIIKYLQDSALANYRISNKISDIDNDLTRRYFESRLAYESLKTAFQQIDKQYLRLIILRLMSNLSMDAQTRLKSLFENFIIPDRFYENLTDVFKEYIGKIKSIRQYEHFSPDEKAMHELVVRIGLLGIVNVFYVKAPMDIYNTNIFYKSRGRELKTDQEHVRSNNLGILKSSMPISIDDLLFSKATSSYLRPADAASYNLDDVWPRENFKLLTQPFSNSISGTMLCQLRMILYIQKTEANYLKDINNLIFFIRLFSSSLLLNSGGHSYFEFIAPLMLEESKKHFSSVEGFSSLDMRAILLDGNETEFDRAINDTIKYNEIYQKRIDLLDEIRSKKAVIAKNILIELINRLNSYQGTNKTEFIILFEQQIHMIIKLIKPVINEENLKDIILKVASAFKQLRMRDDWSSPLKKSHLSCRYFSQELPR